MLCDSTAEECLAEDYDESQRNQIELTHWNPGLPMDLAFSLDYDDRIRAHKTSHRNLRINNLNVSRFWYYFRKRILKRDRNRCVECGSGDKLNVHHIATVINNPLEEYSEENCVTLCEKCHRDQHRRY